MVRTLFKLLSQTMIQPKHIYCVHVLIHRSPLHTCTWFNNNYYYCMDSNAILKVWLGAQFSIWHHSISDFSQTIVSTNKHVCHGIVYSIIKPRLTLIIRYSILQPFTNPNIAHLHYAMCQINIANGLKYGLLLHHWFLLLSVSNSAALPPLSLTYSMALRTGQVLSLWIGTAVECCSERQMKYHCKLPVSRVTGTALLKAKINKSPVSEFEWDPTQSHAFWRRWGVRQQRIRTWRGTPDNGFPKPGKEHHEWLQPLVMVTVNFWRAILKSSWRAVLVPSASWNRNSLVEVKSIPTH